jgi:hypothetical protein
VKFNHPRDGRAHFSGVGVRPPFTQSRPLRQLNSHLFSVNFWDVTGFEFAGSEKRGRERVSLAIQGNGGTEREIAGRLAAWCYHRSLLPYLGDFELATDPTRPARWILKDGEVRETLILAPPQPHTDDDDLVVLISYFPGDISSGPGYPVLTFAGGWEGSRDQSQPDSYLNFLILKYAREDEDFDDMERLGGSLDRVPDVSGQEAA